MTKTSEELLPCPFCGSQPIYEVGQSTGSPSEPDEYYESIYCSNPACTPFEEVESWNTRVNKEAEFLEELKEFINKENNKYSPMSVEYCFGERDAYNNILHKIKKFQAEQKVDDEN